MGIVILVTFNKMLVIVFNINFTLDMGRDPKKTQSFNLCQFLTLSVINGQTFIFITNVPWNSWSHEISSTKIKITRPVFLVFKGFYAISDLKGYIILEAFGTHMKLKKIGCVDKIFNVFNHNFSFYKDNEKNKNILNFKYFTG